LAIESMKRADLVVTPSDSMGQMIRQSCPKVENRRFKTLYHGFRRDSLHSHREPDPGLPTGPRGLMLLYPTHAAPHKGFDVLFRMLASLKSHRSDFTLFTTIANEDWPAGVRQFPQLMEALGIRDHVVITGRVPQQSIGTLYEQADLMVYPSLCESFGFSLLEAMGHCLPIVAAGTPVNMEICGDAALYYDPLDHEAGARAVEQAAEPERSAQLVANACRRMHSYDWGWSRYAREFSSIVQEVASWT
jgi:glycosyltransferase involved in cell wall biosynthesis